MPPQVVLIPESTYRIRRRRRVRLTAGAVLVVLLLLALMARPTLRYLRSWHAHHLANQGIVFIEKQQWQLALASIQQAARLRPDDPVVLRSEARLLTETRNFLMAFDVWQRLSKLSGTWTADDRRDYATAALSQGEVAAATAQLQLLRQLPTQGRPPDWLLAARLAGRVGDRIAEGEECMRVIKDAESGESDRCEAATLVLVDLKAPALRTVAWATLENVANGKSPVSLQALLFFAAQQLNQTFEPSGAGPLRNDIAGVIQRLESHPLANFYTNLRVLDLKMKVDPSLRETLIADIVSRAPRLDDQQLYAACTWLLNQKRAQDVLSLLPPPRASRSRELSAIRAEAMASLGLWKELEAELQDATSPSKIDDLTAQLYLASCAGALQERVAFVVRWDRAFDLASGDAKRLLEFGHAAEVQKLFDRAEAGYRAAVSLDPKKRELYTPLLRVVSQHGGAAKAVDVLELMRKQWPNDTAIANSAVYAGLIAGSITPSAAQATIEPLVHEFPAETSFKATLAMAHLKQGQASEALHTFGDSLDISANGPVRPSTLAVHALVLAANNMNALARIEADQVSQDDLVAEERALLAPLQSRN